MPRVKCFSPLFPSLIDKPACLIDLCAESRKQPSEELQARCNLVLDPARTARLIDYLVKARSCIWSYGGYLEDRSFMFKGSYLDQTGRFLHLGYDFNIPANTPVAQPWDAKVIIVDDDHDPDGGWGPRAIVQPVGLAQDLVVIFAHLCNIELNPERSYPAGTIIGKVGAPPLNGNWWPHLHVQAVQPATFKHFLETGLEQLDGYGDPNQLKQLSLDYPDPLKACRLLEGQGL